MDKLNKSRRKKERIIIALLLTICFIIFGITVSHLVTSRDNYSKTHTDLQNKNEINTKNNSTLINKKRLEIKKQALDENALATKNDLQTKQYVNVHKNATIFSLHGEKRQIAKSRFKARILGSSDKSYYIIYSDVYNNKIDNLSKKNNKLIYIAKVSKNECEKINRKVVYLTFDDGPTSMTFNVLKILKKNNVKATFFFNKAVTSTDKKVVKNIVKDGHLLALHTYSHDYKKVYKNKEAFIKDLEKNRNNFKDITGYDSKYFRFPGGTNNTVSFAYGGKKVVKQIIKETRKRGYEYVDWNAFPEDTGSKMPVKQYNRVLRQAKYIDSGEVVILMHVFNNRKTLPKGLDNIIKEFKSRGYSFDTVNHLENPVKFDPAG